MATLYVDDDYVLPYYVQTGITVTWPTRVIFIPRTEMTLIQSSPIVVYEININTLRLALKDLEDGEEGMPYPDTHSHNPPVSISGITLARVFEIINNYTVTLEDGQYAVNFVGANSNIADVININNVSVRIANSAGLIYSETTITEADMNTIVDKVWDEPLDDHQSVGSIGEWLSTGLLSVKKFLALK